MTMSRREMEFLIRFKADASQALNQIRTQLQGVGTTANKLNRATSTAGAQVAASMNNAAKSTKALNNHTQSLVGSMHALRGAVVSLGVASFSKALVKTSTDMDSLRAKLSFTFGANSGAVFQELSADADRLGIRLIDLADQFGSFSAAARATGLDARTVKDTFIGVAEATKALKLPAEQTKGALFAIQQMMAKGKVNSEEFRLQLAERLPIAMLAATRATNKTSAEFTELLETGKLVSAEFVPKFAKQLSLLSQASLSFSTRSLQSELARATNVLDKFFITVGDYGFKQSLTNLLKSFGDASSIVERLGKSFGYALSFILDMTKGLVDLLIYLDRMTGGLSTNTLAILAVTTAVTAILPLLGLFTGGVVALAGNLIKLATSFGILAAATSPVGLAVLYLATVFSLLDRIIYNFTGVSVLGDAFEYVSSKVKYFADELLASTTQTYSTTKSMNKLEDGLDGVRQALIEAGKEVPYVTQYLKELNAVTNTNAGGDNIFDTIFGDKMSQISDPATLAELGLRRDDLNKLGDETKAAVASLTAIQIEGKYLDELTFDEMINNWDRIVEELNSMQGRAGDVGKNAKALTQTFGALGTMISEMRLSLEQAVMTGISDAGRGGSATVKILDELDQQDALLTKLKNTYGAKNALDVFNFAQSNKLDANDPLVVKSILGRGGKVKDALEREVREVEDKGKDASRRLKQVRDNRDKSIADFLDAINSDQYDSIFLENMPGSRRMIVEAQKGLKDLEKVYADGAALGAKLDDKQMADREARFSAHRKHIEDIQKKSNQVMLQEQEQASKDTIEALRRNPEIASQAQAAIEQLRFDAEYKTGVMADYFLSAFDKATDALADFVTTGKANISDFVSWAAKELAKIALTNIGTQIAGGSGISKGLSTAGSFLKTLFLHSGGVVGASGNATRMVDPSMFIGAPRFHSGLKPDEFPAILQRGETVIPRNQSASSFMGGGNISIPMSVNVNIAGGAGGSNGSSATTEDAQRIGAYVADTVSTRFYALLDKEQRPGGRLAGTRGGL